MDAKRRGELAVMVCKHYLRRKNFNLTSDSIRKFTSEMSVVGKGMGVSPEESSEFAEDMIRELAENALNTLKNDRDMTRRKKMLIS